MDRSTQYMFASARVRFMEMKLPGKEVFERMLAARSGQEARALLGDYGIDKDADLDAALSSWLVSVFDTVVTSAEDPHIADVLRFPYDANNIKALIKGYLRGVNVDDTLSPLGTLDPSALRTAVETGSVSDLPELAMTRAILPALGETAKSGDPQRVDILLDAACYADMKDAVSGRSEFVRDGFALRVDAANLMTAFRTVRLWRRDSSFEPADFLLEGGTIGKEKILSALGEGQEGILALLAHGRYEKLGATLAALPENMPLGAIEKALDNFRMTQMRRAVYIPFGEEVLLSYLAGCEAAAENIRILMAGKSGGLSAEEIRERMRISYV